MPNDECVFCGGVPARLYNGASIIDDACRRWWDCPDHYGKRIANTAWDDIPSEWKADYRRRMASALGFDLEMWTCSA